MMTVRFLVAFAFLLLFDTVAQVGFKVLAAQGAPLEFSGSTLARLAAGPWPVLVAICFVGAFVAYAHLVQNAAVGPLFAASHLDVVVVALVTLFVFGERLDGLQVAGCVVIAAGVLLLGWTESRHAGDPADS